MEYRWLQNLLFFFFFFHKKEHSPWLHTQTSDLKITKFHFDCGGVKDRRQMHWLPANLDIHFFFPHPGSQQLQTRVQVRSSVARHAVSASPQSLIVPPQPCVLGMPTYYLAHQAGMKITTVPLIILLNSQTTHWLFACVLFYCLRHTAASHGSRCTTHLCACAGLLVFADLGPGLR